MAFQTHTEDQDSGTMPVDNNGDNGWSWDTLFSNAGSVLLGGASLVNAFKGNQPVTNVYQAPQPTQGGMSMNNIWIWIGLALVIIVILFLVMKK